ncbi:cytochrome P450 [Granulicella paludicola]|uniref:cytochrome P450 n=1 Tax=Granulicella paludicola TaxID=474951 RepID=UPI0021E02426|nr:cytochrome P450 [Granulicella paludicola]
MESKSTGLGRLGEFTLKVGVGGNELDVHSLDFLKRLFARYQPVRYRPLVRFLSVAMRHKVMIVADGEEWRRTRAVVDLALQPRLVEGEYAEVILDVAKVAFERVARRVGEGVLAVEIEPLMRAVATSALGHLMFGETLPLAEAEWVERTLTAATEVRPATISARMNRQTAYLFGAMRLGARQPIFLHRSQRSATREMFAWLDERVAEMELSGRRSALFEQMSARYAALGQKEALCRIASEYFMLFVAGIETTASALTTAIAEIAGSPEIRERVVDEARGPSGAGALTEQYPYIHAVFREALRRHTVVPTMLRETETEYQLEGRQPSSRCPVHVLKGTAIRYLPLLGHMRRSIWGDPRAFRPERFLRPLTLEQTQHYLPFGFGPQRCPGHALARVEAILLLVAFFRRFDVEQQSLAGIVMERNAVFTNRPVGVKVRVRCAEVRHIPTMESSTAYGANA